MGDFNDSEVYTDDIPFAFIGNEILFNSLSENEKKKELIRLGIATQVHYVFIYKNIYEYPYLRRYTSKTYAEEDNIYPYEKMQISDSFIFENKAYRLNPKVIEYMYCEAERHVKEYSSFELDRFKEKLDHLFTFADNNIEKIEILKESKKKLKKEYLKLIKGGVEQLIISFENPKLYGYDNLRDNIISSLEDNDEDIDVFLISGVIRGLYIPDLWLKAEILKKRMKLCSELINEFSGLNVNDKNKIKIVDTLDTSLQVFEYEELFKLNNNSNNKINDKPVYNSLSKSIFKENGEEIFNYIVSSYQEEKKPAFYNYLYYFLQDKLKKLKLEDEHSDTYTSYVIKKGLLKKYGRMQKSRSIKNTTHDRMMNLFQEMYSLKFEQTMSKDE
jgi:hypothetical protein